MQFHYKNTAEIKPVGYGSYFYTLWNETACIQKENSFGSYALVAYNCIDTEVSLENISS